MTTDMAAQADPQDVAAVLTRAGDITLPALRAAVERLAPQNARIAGYHFGWLDADGEEVESRRGKGIRYTLALLSAQAAGGDEKIGIPGAVAVELVHNFSLLHDDLMDGDTERHHRATAWTIFGSSSAILGGVALLALAEEVLLELQSPQGAAAAKMLTEATSRLVTGQTDDLEFESRTRVGLDECLTMAGNKTSALISVSSAIGAILAGAPENTVQMLAEFGEHLGLAFQLVDDLLGIWGTPQMTGKPVLADLRAGKKTLPVTAALAAGGDGTDELAGVLARAGAATEDELARGAALVEALGGREWAEQEARRQLARAHAALDAADIDAAARRDLAAIADFVVRRQL